MKKIGYKKRILLGFSAVIILLFSLALALSSCGKKEAIKSKEEIVSLMTEESDKEKSYVSSYLDDWGITNFIKSKMKGIELIYRDYYVTDIPDAYTLATGTVQLFLEYFYDDTDLGDEDKVTDGLIACYVETIGDPYSFYRTPEEYQDYDTDLSGTFAGIGVTVQYSYLDETMTVTSVTIGLGAEEAGILPGDLIVKADGVPVKELGYQKTISTIRGEIGTSVEVTVERDGVELTFNIVRKEIVEETVIYSLDENKVGYIIITDFKDVTYSQFKKAIDFMVSEGAKGIIYDLRSNPGGYVSSVVSVLSYIAPKGTNIVSFTNGYADPIKSNNSHSVSLPTVVLCNEYTASAAELFTASIRDWGDMGLFDVTIVGANTYGKGVMQNSYSFTDGSAITLTVAYYNPPSGVNYDGIGIKPDVEIVLGEEGDAQLDAAKAEIAKLINKD